MKDGIVLLAVFLGAAAWGMDLRIAENKATDYVIVAPEKTLNIEKKAIRDLRHFLKEITGANFKMAPKGDKCIFIGQAAPSDKDELKPFERLVKTENGNIYIYGKGRTQNAFAIYDFLEKFLGCRWYTISGDMKIPKQSTLVLPEIDFSLVPSIPELDTNTWDIPAEIDFYRRARINTYPEKTQVLGHKAGHNVPCYMPSGLIPSGQRVGGTYGPYIYFKDKKYFETNPEYFSMDKDGKRVTDMHFCFSNPEMRQEFFKNVEYTIEKEYKGGNAIMSMVHDDHSGEFCYCDNCQKLKKEYGSIAGPYFDFIIDLAEHFGKKYPKVVFKTLAYSQTLTPPDKIKMLPPNVMMRMAALGVDFSKPLNHPNNQRDYDKILAWRARTASSEQQIYPTTYPRPIVSHPLTANIHRLVLNMRLAAKDRMSNLGAQFGSRSICAFAFNDLRLYMLAQLAQDVNLDEQKTIKDFMDGCYADAADLMYEYYLELEKLEAEFPYFLRWNPDIRFIRYATPANLLRWEADFDRMEKLTAGLPEKNLNVRYARYNLDQMVLASWHDFDADEQARLGGLSKVLERAYKTVDDQVNAIYSSSKSKNTAENIALRIKWYQSGLDQFAAMAGGGKPLPESFDSIKTTRLLPNRNKLGLDRDENAAFGLCNTGNTPSAANRSWFQIRNMTFFPETRILKGKYYDTPETVTLSRILKAGGADGQYNIYSLGKVKLEPDCALSIRRVSHQSDIFLGHLFQPENPDRLFQLWISLAYDKKIKEVKIDQLIVAPLTEKAKSVKRDSESNVVEDFQ